jgi:putative nucleotidyltransferase with HDIG domain
MISATDVQNLFGEHLALIKDDDLRQKTVDTWVAGCSQGGWESVEQLKSMPFTLLTDTHGIDFIQHTLAVTEGALALAQAKLKYSPELPYAINIDFVVAGGILHDVGKLLEIQPDGQGGFRKSFSGRCARHPISGAILADHFDLPAEIVNIIACHSREGDGRPQRVETILVHQADFATFNPLVMLNKGTLIVDGEE